jgi:hypothetical protein
MHFSRPAEQENGESLQIRQAVRSLAPTIFDCTPMLQKKMAYWSLDMAALASGRIRATVICWKRFTTANGNEEY